MKKWLFESLVKIGVIDSPKAAEPVEHHVHVYKVETAPEWSKDDSIMLRQFLGSESGLKLIGVINATSIRTNKWAITMEPNKNFDNASGFAQGYSACADQILTIARIAKISEEDREQEPESLLERLKT